MSSYSLTIVGNAVPDKVRSYRSTSRYVHDLERNMRARGMDVTVCPVGRVWHPDGLVAADVILVHDYVWHLPKSMLEYLRSRCRLLCSFLEIDPGQPYEVAFTLVPCGTGEREVVLPYVVERKVGGAISRKVPGSVLIDHCWQEFRYGMPQWERTQEVVDLLAGSSRRVGRLIRSADEEDLLAPGMEALGVMPFRDYLRRTAPYESFVVTHKGSYNGSIVDMAVRGVRVVAFRGFVPQAMVRDLGVIEVGTIAELARVLDRPPDEEALARVARAPMGMDEAVRVIDKTIRAKLAGGSA